MEPVPYDRVADALSKYQTSNEWNQVLWLILTHLTVLGVAVCTAWVLVELIRAFQGRRRGVLLSWYKADLAGSSLIGPPDPWSERLPRAEAAPRLPWPQEREPVG